jgi:hypothetical protein
MSVQHVPFKQVGRARSRKIHDGLMEEEPDDPAQFEKRNRYWRVQAPG